MENIEFSLYDMEFRCPQQSAVFGICGTVKYKMLFGTYKFLDGIALTYIERVIAVRIIGGNKIVFSLPVTYAGICPVGRDGEVKMFSADISRNFVRALFVSVNALIIPVDIFKYGCRIRIMCHYPVVVKFLAA